MALLDMPPEIFQKIIASYVHTVGIRKAWERRKVCETFAAFISQECFGRQPMNKYMQPKAKQLFLQHLRLFLEYRCENSYGAPSLLPNLVRDVVEQFVTATGGQTPATVRSDYMDQVCDAIKRHCPETFHFATKPMITTCKKVASDPVGSHCLVIAIWMKDKELITYYLAQGISVWENTRAFPSPINIAARLQDVKLMSQLLEHAKSNLAKKTKAKPAQILDHLIHCAITSKQWDTAMDLIEWWYRYLRKPGSSRVASWVINAADAQATEPLYRILAFDLTRATKTKLVEHLYNLHSVWSDRSMHHLAGAMIYRNLLDTSKFYTDEFSFSGSILDLVVYRSDMVLARRLLQSGLSPNGLQDPEGNLEYPLVLAVKNDDEAMVELLLAHDADPEPARSWLFQGPYTHYKTSINRFVALVRAAEARKETDAIMEA